MDADGIALVFWMAVLGLVIVVLAGGIEAIFARPSRRWIRRLRDIERARARWAAMVVADQCFYKQDRQENR